MKYLLLIYDREQDWSKLSEAEQSKIYAEYMKFSQDIRESGNYISGAQLHPVASATSVRIRENERALRSASRSQAPRPRQEAHKRASFFSSGP